MPAVAHIIRRRHSRKRRRQKDARHSAFWFALVAGLPLTLLLTPLIGALALSLWLYAAAASHMPAPQTTALRHGAHAGTRFLDSSGAFLIHSIADPLGDARRWLRLDELPPHLISATQMAKGESPPPQPAFNPANALLQVWRYIIGSPHTPAPGPTGKLVRDAMLPAATSSGMDERLLEIVFLAESARRYSADDLLEWRLNSSYYGQGAFGIEAAAQVYLGKPAAALSLAESVLLAPLVNEPAANPIDAYAQARDRGADLLFRMLAADLIDQAQFDEASASEPRLRKPDEGSAAPVPPFIAFARRQAEAILDRLGYDGAGLLARGALQITTSLDMTLQRQAECAISSYFGQPDAVIALDGAACAQPESQTAPRAAALALIDVSSARLLSLVGEALAGSHQPAAILQPFVYLDAFLRREFTPASMLYDVPLSYPGRSAELIYAPVSPDGVYRGPISLRAAMAGGLLPPAAQVASRTGMESAIQTAQTLGFNSLGAGDLELLERGGAVSVMDAAYAYSVLAAGGRMRGIPAQQAGNASRSRDPVAVLAIEDADGRLLWSRSHASENAETALVELSAVYMVNDILADARARDARPAAFISGMSADGRDSWSVGYTPDLSLALHAGSADGEAPSPLADERASLASAWGALMDGAHAHLELPPRAWDAPPDIQEFLVCEISGMLPATSAHCPTRREIVPAGSTLQRDRFWQTFEINRVDRQLATVNTPDALRQSVAYFIPPDEIMDWWLANDMPMPPSSYSTDSGAQNANPVRFTSPANFAYVGATLDIAAVINRAGAQSWRLEYGADANPERWFSLGAPQPLDGSREIATTWETALLSGIYTLRLVVTFDDGATESDTRLLTFDNTPPSVTLRTSDDHSEIRYPSQPWVSLVAEVRDNLTIERVEFYRDGALVGEDRSWPYAYEAEIQAAGDIVFTARAYDQVGNQAASELRVSAAND